MKPRQIFSTLLLIFSISIVNVHSQNFLNGSFELNTAGHCVANTSNTTFNSYVTDVKDIGSLEKLILMYNDSCGNSFGGAQQGVYFITLQADTDSISAAISLKLSDTLYAGNSYEFSYYEAGFQPVLIGSVEIGISTDDSTFGTLIYTSTYLNVPYIWTKRIVNFVSPVSGKYLTVRANEGFSLFGWTFIDNFSFTSTAINSLDESMAFQIYPNPTTTFCTITVPTFINSTLSIYDITGRALLQQAFNERATVNVAQLKAGIYLLEVRDKEGRSEMGKVVRE